MPKASRPLLLDDQARGAPGRRALTNPLRSFQLQGPRTLAYSFPPCTQQNVWTRRPPGLSS
eukprot:1772022-Pyramimonas_sp.AAC.2